MSAQPTTDPPPHPAPYSLSVLHALEDLVEDERARLGREPFIFDPFAGIGRVHELGPYTVGIEIEPEWAETHPRTILGDSTTFEPYATALRYVADWGGGVTFDAICVSPCYGNRMADHHNARERCRACKGTGREWIMRAIGVDCKQCRGKGQRTYKRHTYRHYLGRPLAEANAGAMQWGDAYRSLHATVWRTATSLLAPNGAFILNISDHIRKSKVVEVSAWHTEVLTSIGLVPETAWSIPTPRMRHGANGAARVPNEWVMVFRKPLIHPT